MSCPLLYFLFGQKVFKLSMLFINNQAAQSVDPVIGFSSLVKHLLILNLFLKQKFELKRRPLLLQLLGNLSEEELLASPIATKLNAYAGELCAPHIQMRIDSKISDILRNGWPILREI